MSREIKFRIWYEGPFANEMIYPDLYWFEEEGIREIPNGHTCYTFMQYTGIKDNTDKEIYEGDIVKGKDKSLGIVKYQHAGFDVFVDGFEFSLSSLFEHIEVIGNIYEHPDLLPQGDFEHKTNQQ